MEARRPSLFRKCWFEARDRYLRQVVFTVFFEIARRQGIDRGTRAVGRPHLYMAMDAGRGPEVIDVCWEQ